MARCVVGWMVMIAVWPAAAPDNEVLKRRASVYEKKLANFDEQTTDLEHKAKVIEDEIYRVNQPQPLRFRILKIAPP